MRGIKAENRNMKIWTWIIVIAVAVIVISLIYWPKGAKQITLSFTNLEPLTQGHFEGWAIYGEEKVSIGKFNIGDPLTFTSDRKLRKADQIVITIEPEGDTDSTPSGVVILAGEIINNEVTLSPPFEFTDATGTYILATPTNGDDTNENSGIWFLQLPPPPTAGLNLPTLPTGWKYEGWVVNQGVPITSGRFSAIDTTDEFNGYSGTQPGPPFPGEDYLVNVPEGIIFPINLSDGESLAVISVEPDINGIDPTGDSPFQIKPLVGEIPSGALDHVNYDMALNPGTMPAGTARIG